MPFVQAISWVAKTFRERRRSLREDVRHSAWIDAGNGSPPRLCAVLDVSEDGARILFCPSRKLRFVHTDDVIRQGSAAR